MLGDNDEFVLSLVLSSLELSELLLLKYIDILYLYKKPVREGFEPSVPF